MPFPPQGTLPTPPLLSLLEIDTDKDWLARRILNIGSAVDDNDAVQKRQAILQETMTTRGDVLWRDDTKARRLAGDFGVGYNFLHMGGDLEPQWLDIQDIIIFLTGAVNRSIVAPFLQIAEPSISSLALANASPPGKTTQPIVAIPVPGSSQITVASPGGGVTTSSSLPVATPVVVTELALRHAVDGAVADDGGAQTNETVAANNPTTNDMTLLPVTPVVNDAYYFGHSSLWDWLGLNIGTAGTGSWTIAWEYWNGTAWTALPNIVDGTNDFVRAGENEVTFTRPHDWVITNVGGVTNLFWIRSRVSTFTSITTQPLGTQSWAWIKQ